MGWLVRNLERVIEELEFHSVRAGQLTVAVEYKDAPGAAADGPLEVPTDRFDLLLDAARFALRRAYRPGLAATHMHVIATRLRCGKGEQLSLFQQPNEKLDALARAKRAVNEKVGRFAVRSGATPYVPAEMYRDPSHSYDVCDVRGKVCF
jgi:DNA polymerase V